MRPAATRIPRGFTLLEIMLAFVLLAGAMGLLIGMLSGGLRQVGDGRSETEAALYAQSLLDQLGVLAPIRPGRTTGEFGAGRYAYTLDIAETSDPVPRTISAPGAIVGPGEGPEGGASVPAGDRAPVLYRVALQVRWGGGGAAQSLDISTLRYRRPASETGAAP